MNMKKRLPLLLTAAACFLALLLAPDAARTGAVAGLRLCAERVLPALLPFLFASRLLCGALPPLPCGGRLDRLSSAVFGVRAAALPAFLVGLLGGYPSGAAAIAGLYQEGALEKRDAERALRICNNSGPAFFVSVVASVTGGVRTGLLLYGIHAFSALWVAVTLREPDSGGGAHIRRIADPSVPELFARSVRGTAEAMLSICVLIVCFRVVQELLTAWNVWALLGIPGALRGLALGVLELTSGVLLQQGQPFALPFCAFLMGWGGLCVHFQALSLAASAGLRPRGYCAAKLLHGLFSVLLVLAFTAPRPALLAEVAFLFAVSAVFPSVLKKYAGKKSQTAV